jgi:hypothetical protein
MKLLKYFFIFFLISCTKKYTTVEEYSNYPVKYAKTQISYPNKDFSITIPKNWEWKIEDYHNKNILLAIDIGKTDSITKYTRIMSIVKYKSFENNTDLELEYKSLLKNNGKTIEYPKAIESGKTKLLKYDSYFIHTKSENENSLESIFFIVKSKEKGVFYQLYAGCQIKDDLKTNMSMMIKCLESFEHN